MTLPLGKHSGRHAFARACAEAGFPLERDELADAFRRFKELADTGSLSPSTTFFDEVTAR